jgi:hypothetical protein
MSGKKPISIEIISQFEHGQEATEHTLKLIVAYLLSNVNPTHLAEQNAPDALKTKSNTSFTSTGPRDEEDKTNFSVLNKEIKRTHPTAIACFDIDDTLLHDSDSPSGIEPNYAVLDLLKRLYELGVKIHLITARREEEDMRRLTIEELHGKDKEVNVEGMYESLSMAPEQERKNMSTISRWKMQTRKEIAQSYKCPITLSVGDQWGDCLVLNKDQDLETLDTIVGVESTPYILMRPHDQVSLWALKLRALS